MSNNVITIAITGANGYLGSQLVNYLEANGITCIKLVRNPQKTNERKFILGENLSVETLQNVDYLIHAAYDFSLKDPQESSQINIDGTIKLLNLANKANLKSVIYISSMSSFAKSKSIYGQNKFKVEKYIQENNLPAVIIRPGLIYGEPLGGIMAKLKAISKLPVLPYITISAPLYLCHINDLSHLIQYIIINADNFRNKQVLIAANDTPFSFKQILQTLGAKFLIPIPWQPLWLILKFVELIRLKPRMGSDNLISLVYQNPTPDFINAKHLNIRFQAFKDKK